MVGYLVMEDELLCDAELTMSANFVDMKQGGSVLSQNVHSLFHRQKHFAPYNLYMIYYCNVESLAHWWYTI